MVKQSSPILSVCFCISTLWNLGFIGVKEWNQVSHVCFGTEHRREGHHNSATGGKLSLCHRSTDSYEPQRAGLADLINRVYLTTAEPPHLWVTPPAVGKPIATKLVCRCELFSATFGLKIIMFVWAEGNSACFPGQCDFTGIFLRKGSLNEITSGHLERMERN